MTVYLFYMALPGIVWLLAEIFAPQRINRDAQAQKRFLIFMGVAMALMIGLRSPENGSGDTMFYYNLWESFSTASFQTLKMNLISLDIERGFQITVWLLSHIFKNGQWALFLSGAFMSVSVCWFISKNSKNAVLAFTVFNCLGLFNFMVQGMRQAIAMCICLWAIEQCKTKSVKNLIKFALLVALAATFHASAIVFSVIYIISFAKLNWMGAVSFAIGAGIAIIYLPELFEIINNAINDDYTLGDGSDSGGFFAIFIYIFVIAFGLMMAKRKDRNYALFLYMACIGCICMILRRSTSEIAERINHYFSFSQMIIISNGVQFEKDKQFRWFFATVAFALCFAVAIYKASYSILIPYLFFWQ